MPTSVDGWSMQPRNCIWPATNGQLPRPASSSWSALSRRAPPPPESGRPPPAARSGVLSSQPASGAEEPVAGLAGALLHLVESDHRGPGKGSATGLDGQEKQSPDQDQE